MTPAGPASDGTAVHAAELQLYFVLLQLVVIVMAGRVGAWIARRTGQSAAVGEIVMGILLGPSLLGLVAPELFRYLFHSTPEGPMHVVSQIGLLLLMFQLGLSFDFSHLAETRNRRAVLAVGTASLVLPFLLGFAFGLATAPILSPRADPLASALFIATAFSITALPILGRIMMEFDITHSPLGVIAISAAALNDVVGWIMLAVVSALAASRFSGTGFAANAASIVAFAAAAWFLARPVLRRAYRALAPRDGGLGDHQLGLLLAVTFACAMGTYQLGIFAIFGGFLAGVMLHDEPGLAESWKARVGQFVSVFFLPVFFTYTGLRTDIGSLGSAAAWGWCALLVLLAMAGKFGGAYAAARWAGLGRAEAASLGIMMNTRALMELIVINVGYDLGVISREVFTMLVMMAVASTVITTPCLRRWLPGAGLSRPSGDPRL